MLLNFLLRLSLSVSLFFMCLGAFNMKERIMEKRSAQYRPKTRLTPDDDFKLQ